MIKKRSVGVLLSYINTFLSMICGLFLSSYLIRKIGDTNYGVYQTMSSFATYLVLLEFGMGSVLAKNLSASRTRKGSKEDIEKNISTIWTMMSVLSIIIILVAIIFYFCIDIIYSNSLTLEQIISGKQMFVFIIIYLVSSFILHTLSGIVLAYEHYTFSSSISIIRVILRTTILVCLIGKWNSALIVCAVDAILNVILVIFTYFYCVIKFKVRINFKSFDKYVWKISLPLCLALFLQSIINQTNSQVGKFVIGVMLIPEDVTLYSIGLYIYSIFSSLSVIPVSMYVPQVTKDVVLGKEGKELTRTLIQPCRLIVIVGGTVLFGFFACGRQFINVVYGKQYLLAWLIALFLTIPTFINASNSVVLNVLDVKNKRHICSYISLATTIFNIVMTIIGIKFFGILAAAAATGISILLQSIILNIYYYKVIDIKVMYLFKNIFKGILPYQLLGAIVGFLVGTLIENTIISFLIAGFTYVIIAFGCYLMLGKNENEKIMLKKILNKIFKKNRRL